MKHVRTGSAAHRKLARALAGLLVAVVIVTNLVACGTPPAAEDAALAPAGAGNSTSNPAPGVEALPTVPAALTSSSGRSTVTPSATSSPSPTASQQPTRTSTATPTPTRTRSSKKIQNTPVQTPGPSITPTMTITPTPSPTLTPTPMFTPTPVPSVAVSEDTITILLIGLDSDSNLRSQNTDVIIVVSADTKTKQVSMLSIPRDLWVYIPTHGWSRINTAHRWGYRVDYPGKGPGLLMDTIEMHFGIPIDHWARVDFEGFQRVVDQLGGVEMTVACPVNLRYQAPSSDDPNPQERYLEPGVYHMDGATALRYVRTRRGGSDFDRAQRQHEFLKALWHQAKDPGIIPRIPGLWSALSDSFVTDLGLGDVVRLAPVALDIKPQRIRSRYIGPNQTSGWTNHEGWKVLLPDYERIQGVVGSLYAPPYAKEDEAENEGARIRILNGTYQPQLAKIAADELRWHGLIRSETGLADRPDHQTTHLVVYNDRPKTIEVLREVLGLGPENVIFQPAPADGSEGAGEQPIDMDLTLGSDYNPCR